MSRYRKTMSEAYMEVSENTATAMQIKNLQKAYEPMRNRRISMDNAFKLQKMFDKFDKNKDMLKQLYKADIPFVSGMASARLISKHGMKAQELMQIRKEGIEQALEDIKIINEGPYTLEEGRMKDIYQMQQDGKSAAEIAKLMKLPMKTVKSILGEMQEAAEDFYNPITEACWVGYKKVGMKKKGDRMVPNCVPEETIKEEDEKKDVKKKKDDVAPDNEADQEVPTEKKEKTDDKEKLKADIEKKDNEIAMLKTKAETEKAKVAKKETEKMVNPETGEPLLQVGIAYKHMRDKMKKEKEEVKESADTRELTNLYNKRTPLTPAEQKRKAELEKKLGVNEDLKEFKKMKVMIRDMDKRKKAIADLIKQNLGVSVTGGVIKVDGKGKDLNNFAKDLMNFYGANVVAEGTMIGGLMRYAGQPGSEYAKAKAAYKKFMSTSQPARTAGDKVMGFVFDDELLDDIYSASKKQANKDVRDMVRKRLNKLGFREELEEADLTKSQIKKVHDKADELPKKDFKDRYGKEGDSVRYAVATNIIKKKMGIKENAQVMKGVDDYIKIGTDKIKNHPSFKDLFARNKRGLMKSVGPKYVKIHDTEQGQKRSIHAFIDKNTGDVFKPAGVNQPAKGARGNVTNSAYLNQLKKSYDVHGGHLYRQRGGMYGIFSQKENAPSAADIERLKKQGMKPKMKNEEHPAKEIYEQIKGLKNKAEKSGMPYSILKKVYDRGMAAWRGGHRPGTTQQQWAFARVNSFVTKSSGTWGGADKDLAKQVKKESLDEASLYAFKEYEPGLISNRVASDMKNVEDAIKRAGGRIISKEKPTRREPNMSFEIETGNPNAVKAAIKKADPEVNVD